MNKKRQLRIFAVMASLLMALVVTAVAFAKSSNRNEVRARLAEGGWSVVYGDLINEHDYVEFGLAVAESVATENPAPIFEFFGSQVEVQVAKISRTAPEIGEELIVDLLLKAFDEGSGIVRHGNLELSAGLATYNRWERIVYDEPRTETCWTGGVIKTKYPCVKLVRVEKRLPLPNNFQPYFRFRVSTVTNPPNGAGQIYFHNRCQKPVRLALAYKDTSNVWQLKKWWRFDPLEHSYLASSGTRLTSNNRYFYVYAEATDGSGYRWTGEKRLNFNGTTLPTRQRRLSRNSNGDWVIHITCN